MLRLQTAEPRWVEIHSSRKQLKEQWRRCVTSRTVPRYSHRHAPRNRQEEMKLHPGRLFGGILKTYAGSELRLTETLCPPGLRAPRHSHELFLFCFMIQGGFTEKLGRRKRECTRFTLITHTPDEPHANLCYSAGAQYFVVDIGRQLLARPRE